MFIQQSGKFTFSIGYLRWFRRTPHVFVTLGLFFLAMTWLTFSIIAETPASVVDQLYEEEALKYFNRSIYDISYIGGVMKVGIVLASSMHV